MIMSKIEFEKSLDQTDIQVSKVITTPKGDKIRATKIAGGRYMLTAVGEPKGNIVIVTGETSTHSIASLFGRIWDAIKGAIKGLIDTIANNCTGSVIVTTSVGSDGSSTSVTFSLIC
jgi:hypothetical protein